MASELIVQTIQGPSSGANANKVLIPSGHTLDVSGGTFKPSSGQIVQEHTFVNSNRNSYSGVNVPLFPSTDFTKKYDASTSRLNLQAQIPVRGQWSFANAPYIAINNSTVLRGYGVHIDTANDGTNSGSFNKAVTFLAPISSLAAGTHSFTLHLYNYNDGIYGAVTINPTNVDDGRYPPTNYSVMVIKEVML